MISSGRPSSGPRLSFLAKLTTFVAMLLLFAAGGPKMLAAPQAGQQEKKIQPVTDQAPRPKAAAAASSPRADFVDDDGDGKDDAEDGDQGVEADGDADLPQFLKGKVNKTDYLKARAGWLAAMRGVGTGSKDARASALKQMARQERAIGLLGPDATVAPGLNSSTWSFVGPNPIPNGQTTAFSSAVSGRISAIAVDPTDKNVVWAGAAQGGVYRSLDGGTTWAQMLDGVSRATRRWRSARSRSRRPTRPSSTWDPEKPPGRLMGSSETASTASRTRSPAALWSKVPSTRMLSRRTSSPTARSPRSSFTRPTPRRSSWRPRPARAATPAAARSSSRTAASSAPRTRPA